MRQLGNLHLCIMKNLFRNKRGLGAPVGNLIILMAAVILSTTVVLFATNVTSNQVQKENLYIAEVHLDTERVGITIVNTGPTSISITQITVKGDKFSFSASEANITAGLAKGDVACMNVTLTPDLITINDVGRPITVVVSTTQGAYFAETLVQAKTEE